MRRQFGAGPVGRCYDPRCGTPSLLDPVILHADEIEVLRLVDLLGMTQEEAAGMAGISRRTLWRDLHEARLKIADALVNGRRIVIEGCERDRGEDCPEE